MIFNDHELNSTKEYTNKWFQTLLNHPDRIQSRSKCIWLSKGIIWEASCCEEAQIILRDIKSRGPPAFESKLTLNDLFKLFLDVTFSINTDSTSFSDN